MATRYDAADPKGPFSETTQGFLRVMANIGKVGIVSYKQPDGSLRRELRTAEEVFKPESLATLTGAPLTMHHSGAMLDPRNVRGTRVGGLIGTPRQDGNYLVAELQLEDIQAIDAAKSKKLTQISPGYHCAFEPCPGVWNGQPYDGIQRQITYNHISLVPVGRAGADVSLRLDSSDDVAFDDDLPENPENPPRAHVVMKIKNVEIKLDQRDEALIQDELTTRDTRIAALEKEAAARDVEQVELQTRLDSAEERVQQIDRNALETSARAVLGAAVKFEGQKDEQVRAAVIAKVFPTLRLDGKGDEYLKAVYDSALVAHVAKPEKKTVAPPAPRQDADPEPEKKSARDAMLERRRNMCVIPNRGAK